MIKDLKNNRSGISLIELLVVIGIMVFINSAILLSEKTVNTSRNVTMTAFKMASDFRKMQSFTLNLKDIKGVYPAGGWGIYLNTTTSPNNYLLFADAHNSTADHKYTVPADELFLSEKMSSKTKISQLRVYDSSNVMTVVSSLHISFEPPDSLVWICDATDCTYAKAEIEISNVDETIKDVIMVNKFGLVDKL